eukprot:jgi/Hompol1/5345/HPOL_004349-RA
MPVIPIAKPQQESPRPQRRHYFDKQLCELQNKLLKYDLRPKTSDSTYQSDYKDYQHITHSARTDRRSRRKFDSYIAPLTDLERLNQQVKQFTSVPAPTQKDADRLLYLSTYQQAYTTQKQRLGVTEFHYMDDRQRQHERRQISPEENISLYHDSYHSHKDANMAALNNPGKQHVMTKCLDQDMTPNLTVKDLFHGDGKSKKTTSYQFDFRDFKNFKSGDRVVVQTAAVQSVPRAVKYRKWAQQ